MLLGDEYLVSNVPYLPMVISAKSLNYVSSDHKASLQKACLSVWSAANFGQAWRSNFEKMAAFLSIKM